MHHGYEELPLNARSTGLATSIVVPGAHVLYGFTVLNTNASAQFIQVFDQRTLPADGAVPDVVISASGSADREMLWIPPRKMLEGIVICNSSTSSTKTIGSADCFFDVQYAP